MPFLGPCSVHVPAQPVSGGCSPKIPARGGSRGTCGGGCRPESGRDCLTCATGRDWLIYLAVTVLYVLAAGVEELVEEVVDFV